MTGKLRNMSRWGAPAFPCAELGKSFFGNSLYFVKAQKQTRVMIVAGIHGEEPETVILLSRALRLLEEPPNHVSCILCANPDGLLLGTRANARGVDLNRNFPTTNWSKALTFSRPWLEAERLVELSCGDAPASEAETKIMLSAVQELKPQALISLHAPLACIDSDEFSPLAQDLSHLFSLPWQKGVGYATPGSLGTWATEQKLPCITVELARQAPEILAQAYAAPFAEWILSQ